MMIYIIYDGALWADGWGCALSCHLDDARAKADAANILHTILYGNLHHSHWCSQHYTHDLILQLSPQTSPQTISSYTAAQLNVLSKCFGNLEGEIFRWDGRREFLKKWSQFSVWLKGCGRKGQRREDDSQNWNGCTTPPLALLPLVHTAATTAAGTHITSVTTNTSSTNIHPQIQFPGVRRILDKSNSAI